MSFKSRLHDMVLVVDLADDFPLGEMISRGWTHVCLGVENPFHAALIAASDEINPVTNDFAD